MLPADAFTNVTTRVYTALAKTTTPATGGKPYQYGGSRNYNNYYDDYYDNYGYAGGSTANNNYQDLYKAKSKLLTSINAFHSLYNINESKLVDLVEDFCQFLQIEVQSQNVPFSYDGNKLEDALTVALQNFQLTCEHIAQDVIDYEDETDVVVGTEAVAALPAPVQEINFETLDLATLDSEQILAYSDGQDSAQLGLQIDEALRWYTFTNDLIPYFKAGYNEAESRLRPLTQMKQ